MKNFTEAAYTHWPLVADHILQATVLLGAILILTRLLQHLSSAHKHALLLAGLLGIPLLLLVATVSPGQWKVPGSWLQSAPDSPVAKSDQTFTPIPLKVESTITVEQPLTLSSDPASTTSVAPLVPITESSSTPPQDPSQPSWPIVFAAIWISGIALGLLRLGIGWLSLRFAMRKLHTCASPEIIDQFNEVQRIHPGLPRTRLLESPNASMPMTFGSLRPAIVMPSDANDWSADRLQRVLLHEFAHVARRDCLTNALALASACLLWFHPLAWITWQLLRREQESAADDWAIQHTTDAEAYADDLVAIVRDYPRHLAGVGLALSIAMARGNRDLRKRLDLLLGNRRDRSSCGRRMILALAPVCLFLVVVLGGLAACRDQSGTKSETPDSQDTRTFTLSEVQQSRLLIRINDDPFADHTNKSDYDMQQSLMRIREAISSLNITPPVANISLPYRQTLVISGSSAALDQIEQWLSTFDGTREAQIEIAAKVFKLSAGTDVEALLIGTTQAGNTTTAAKLTDAAGAELLEKLRLDPSATLIQSPRIISRANQRAKFEQIREMIYPTEYERPRLDERPSAGQPASTEQLKGEILRLRALLEIDGDRIIEEAADLGIKNASLITQYPRRLELRAQLARLTVNKGHDDPEVQAMTAELDEVNRMLQSGVTAAKTALETELMILNKTLEQFDPGLAVPTTIIPALPTAFETRNAGTTFTFLPRILSDDRIDIEFELEHVRFLGFFDYGPTIQSGVGTPVATKIQQPIFETSKCSSSTTIESGSWIVVTGLGAKGTSGAPDLKEGVTPKFDASDDLDDSEFLVLIRVSRADAP